MNLPPYKLLTTQRDWQACLEKLQREPRVAIDLEANSMYAYRERICLIQITIPEQDYILDPLPDIDLSGLGELLQNREIEKIFHAAEYDLSLLKREYEWQVNNLFDTMWAARILGYERYGLASMLETLYGIELDKRYQKSNWCKRPLSPEQLVYAQLDTHYLLRLRDALFAELESASCLTEAFETFAEQTQVKLSDNSFDPEGFWSISGAYDLEPQQQAILRELYIYRDQEARQRNQPLFKIFSERTLLEAARKEPTTLDDLRQIHGMSSGQIRRYGRSLLSTITKGQQASIPTPPKRPKRPADEILNRYDKLHTWRKLRAQARGVESDVIISRDALWAIARQNPQTVAELAQLNEIGSWRCQTYGSEIINLIQETD